MTRRAASWIALVALSTATATAQPAPSADDRAAAKAAFARGNTHFNLAEYDDAIAAFKESYKLVPAPLLLYNIAQAYRKKRDCAQAATFYRSYLREAPDAKNRARIEDHITEMEACAVPPPPTDPAAPPPPGDPTAPSGDPTAPSGDPTAPPPPGDATSPPPPTATVPTMETPVTAAPPSVLGDRGATGPTFDRGRSLRWGGLALGAAGVVGVGFGVAMSVRAGGLSDDVAAACADGCTAEIVAEFDRRGAAADRAAAIGYIAGGAAIAGGLALYLVGRARAESATVSVAAGPGGVTAAARVTW